MHSPIGKQVPMMHWLDDDAWMDDAACVKQSIPTDIFFPENNYYAPARRVCLGCPVSGDCLSWSLLADQRFGMWGGMTPDERERFAHAVTVDFRHPSSPQ